MAADLTPEQYEMLFGEPPPPPAATGRLTFSEITPGHRRSTKRTRALVARIREHPVDAAIVGLLIVGAVVGVFFG